MLSRAGRPAVRHANRTPSPLRDERAIVTSKVKCKVLEPGSVKLLWATGVRSTEYGGGLRLIVHTCCSSCAVRPVRDHIAKGRFSLSTIPVVSRSWERFLTSSSSSSGMRVALRIGKIRECCEGDRVVLVLRRVGRQPSFHVGIDWCIAGHAKSLHLPKHVSIFIFTLL